MGSLSQTSCGQDGGGADCLLLLGLGPRQGKHNTEAFPTTCRISQPSLQWLDSWAAGMGLCELPGTFSQRPEGMSVHTNAVLGAAAWE